MKLHKRYNKGGLLLAVLVLVIAVVVIGILAYAIYKAITRLPVRPINPDDVAQWIQTSTAEMQTNMPSDGILSDGTFFVPLTQTNYVNIERTTNLVDWEVIATIAEQDIATFPCTNGPWPMLFYRVKGN